MGLAWAQLDNPAPATPSSAPKPAAISNASAQTSATTQQSNNSVYKQNQNSGESYQKIQVQAIQEVASNPKGTANASQTEIQAADVFAPGDQNAQRIAQGNITIEPPQQKALEQMPRQDLPVTTEQAAAEDFPLFRIAKQEGRIAEKRVDLRTLTPEIAWQKQVLTNAAAVGVVVEKNKLHAVTDSIFQLDIGLTLGQQFKLCPGTPFLDQPVIGLGTAFILNEQMMITANHVFMDEPDRYVIVFGFEMVNKVGAYEGLIALKDIYYPKRIIQSDEILDVAIFEVTRPLDRPVLNYSISGTPAIYSQIYMIGHPYGLPKKVALDASVQSAGREEYFYTTLVASQGNSGSPVFDMNTHKVIGILVSGEVDYTWNGSCNSSSTCRIPYCKGEKVINIAALEGIKEFVSVTR
jgi:hypothetical protein